MSVRHAVLISLVLLGATLVLGALHALVAARSVPPGVPQASALLGGPSATPTCGPGAWTTQTPYPMTDLDQSVVAYHGLLYSFGGYTGTAVTSAAYNYNPATNQWTGLAPLPAPRAGAGIVSDGTYLYIFGGLDVNFADMTTLWRYDPATDSYLTTLAPVPTGAGDAAAAYLNGEIVRIAGQVLPGTPTNAVQIYTISTNTWRTAASYPLAVLAFPALVLNGTIYTAGGTDDNLVATNKTYRYDPISDSWDDAAIADLPATIQGAAAGLVNGQWVIAGGYRNNVVSNAVNAWDPISNQWTVLPNMPRARRYLGGAAVGPALYALGGFDSNTQATADNQQYLADCGAPAPTASPSPSPSATHPAPPSATTTPLPGATASPPPSPTLCPLTFSDVPAGSTFYAFIRCLACRGIVGGYPCGGPGEPCPGPYFRPNLNVTRGQVSKIVASAAQLADPVPSTQQTFADVAPDSPFWLWVERLSTRGIVGGYPCGGLFEPCIGPENRPYFRPNNNVTRGQLSKIVAGAAGWTETPTTQTFAEVLPGSTFYVTIERVASRGIVTGYLCGGAGEPCIGPANRPYFRPNNNATRGQMSKIAAAAFFPNCQTPVGR